MRTLKLLALGAVIQVAYVVATWCHRWSATAVAMSTWATKQGEGI